MTHIVHSEKVLSMRIILSVLILIFSLQSWTKADEISEFEIMGMSIGDSLLDFFSLQEIGYNLKNANYTSDKYTLFEVYKADHQLDQYDALMIHFRKNDKNYKIFSVSGVIEFANNIQGCTSKKKEIDLELLKLFKNLKRNDYGFSKAKSDKSGKSSFSEIEYKFQTMHEITIQCYDWSEEIGYMDHLRISLHHSKFIKWINNEAYN